MAKPTDIRVLEATTRTERAAYRAPIKFGGRVVTDAVLLDVTLVVETRDGRRAEGFGSMPLGSVWAWPGTNVSGEQALAAMQTLGERAARLAADYTEFGHPLEIAHDLTPAIRRAAADVARSMSLAEPLPRLAEMVAASPVDAALHDAYGKALGANSYNLLGAEYCNRDLASFLSAEFRGEHLDRYTLRSPKSRMPLYHLVGALDPLTAGDVRRPIGDGLPETLGEWIVADGLSHLKIKLAGDDLAWDVERVIAVERVAVETQAQRGCQRWQYSLDFNERCASVQYVLDFLAGLAERAPAAFDRVQYIEQPTHRDLANPPQSGPPEAQHSPPRSGPPEAKHNQENRMHAAARIKPVVIDESLIDFESLLLARELGYSGVALKACKGHTEALLMGAAAQKFGLFLCVQDLTCPGASFLHSASLAARIPTVAAIEGNARQYCPAANRAWAEKYPDMFDLTDGTLGTHVLAGSGLGY